MILERDIETLIDAASKRLGIKPDQAEKEALAETVSQAFKRAPYPLDASRMVDAIHSFRPAVVVGPDISESARDLVAMRSERLRVWPTSYPFLIGPLVGLGMLLHDKSIAVPDRKKAMDVFSMIGYAIRQQQPVH